MQFLQKFLPQKPQPIWGLIILGALFFMVACDGCSEKKEDTKQQEKSVEKPTEIAQKTDAGAQKDDRFDRLVFGLPIPPNPVGLVENGDEVRVQVKLGLNEVGEFFEENFVDYEILYPRDEVRAVGLRDYMPRVYAYPYGSRSFVVYTRAELTPDEVKVAQKKAKAQNIPPPKNMATYKKGDPVTERTANGQLLAPGARWGEPYTPPPGSPLDTLHFKSNFGRPYGEWIAR